MTDRWTKKLGDLLRPHRSPASPLAVPPVGERRPALVVGGALPQGWEGPLGARWALRATADPEEALELVRFEEYELILVTVEGLPVRPPDLVATLRAYRSTPILVVGGETHRDLLAEALRAGADDYLPAGRPVPEILLLLDHALTRCSLLRETGVSAPTQRDFLTGLLTAEAFHQVYRPALARSRRFGERLGLVRVNLLNLEGIYAAYGVRAGDRLVQEVARLLRAHVRGTDSVARLERDRFVLLLVGATRERTRQVADQILSAAVRLQLPEHPDLRVSLRVGWSTAEGEEDPLVVAERVLQEAG
ncbi:MAG: GGDEF domain-containing response regulator [Armatimonadota bacterium]|nr:GGDEF domain-containing response regulator [Armatimonadota bacterium]MDR7444764.1 GGDEF domain-containing response regulator [Armatimonadota bacterium]MDR7569234.1 GGDEF domain-containing response regulator [Armatimonadota bacterium]MDR7613352.1 GGDEF domain-containing response regulator [Armatimonadota bacterium]